MSVLAIAALLVASPPEIVLEDRTPIALLVLTGNLGVRSSFGISGVIAAASASFLKRTDLYVLSQVWSASDDAIARCSANRFSCWVNAVRGEHPRYLLVVSFFHEDEGRDRISSMLIDVVDAEKIIDGADQTSRDWESRVEDAIFQSAAQPPASFQPVINREGLELYFDALIEKELRPALEATAHFEPYGTIEIHSARGGLAIELDGTAIGSTRAGVTTVRNVRSGSRVLSFFAPDRPEVKTKSEVLVERGKTTPVSPDLQPLSGPTWPNDAARWSGVGLTGAGTVITGLAIAFGGDRHQLSACIRAGCRERSRFSTIGGVRTAPLGYSLMLSGAIIAIGAWLSDDERVPWLPILLGVAAGGLSYGLSTVLDE